MKRIVLTVAIAFALLALKPAERAASKGRIAAREDIKAGLLVLRTYGFAAGARTTYAELLERKLGVRMRAVAGCVVSEDLIAETAAYNAVMTAEIKRRFGPRALDDIHREASRK